MIESIEGKYYPKNKTTPIVHENKIWYGVEVYGDDYILAREIAEIMWCRKEKKGDKKYVKGVINDDTDPIRAERTGKLGEMAFCILFNQFSDFFDFDYAYIYGGDKFDFKYNEKTINVKCSHKNYGKNFIQIIDSQGYKIGLKQDVYVFGHAKHDNKQDRAFIWMTGWTLKRNILQKELVKSPKGKWMNYEVYQQETYPIGTLFEEHEW